MNYPKFKNTGDMLCAMEIETDKGTRQFRLLMKNGEERTITIWGFGEDDVTFVDDNMEPCGWIEDTEIESFIPIK